MSWSLRALRSLYSFVVFLIKPLVRRKYLRRARQGEAVYAERLAERFGQYQCQRPTGNLLWLHAVSLGETKAATALLKALRQANPELRFLLTHSTATGWQAGAELVQEGDVRVWLPWDNLASVRSFYKHFQPQLGILMETEIWPNLLLEAHSLGIPLVLANARMSQKSQKGFFRFAGFSRCLFASLAQVLAQTDADGKRLRSLGAQNISVVGNLKFDAQPNMQHQALGASWRQAYQAQHPNGAILAFVNTRPNEEALFLQACQVRAQRLRALGVQLLLVPRHPQRFTPIKDLCQNMGFIVSERSQWPTTGPVNTKSEAQEALNSIWLGDSLGEMSMYYGLSDLALMGGSFGPYGAHNLIEACVCSVPIWVGPHTYNFAQAVRDGIQAQAVQQVQTMDAALDQALDWIEQPDRVAQARKHAQAFAGMHTGAVAKSVEQLHSTFLDCFDKAPC